VQEVVATYEAETGRHRARVFRLSSGAYRVEVERLYEADDAGGVVHGVFWSAIRGFSSYTNDLDERSRWPRKTFAAPRPSNREQAEPDAAQSIVSPVRRWTWALPEDDARSQLGLRYFHPLKTK
jgi:hypothetical protein